MGSNPIIFGVGSMTRRREEYGRRGRYRIRCTIMGIAIRGAGRRAGTEKANEEKQGAYECGFEPYDDARRQFNIRYYLVAIMFLVFDLEVCYRYPWVVSRGERERVGYRTIREFRRELIVGYVFVWMVGALEWE
jgi:NADH-quinone oxidoreductase subunit A